MENTINMLKEYDDLYYNNGTSPISDNEYDKLKETAKEKFPDNSYFKLIGAPTSNKVKLPFVLGSLKKVKKDKLNEWLRTHGGKYLITGKLDGVSFMVEYRNGKVHFASTRGDGYHGKDITNKAKIFCPKIDSKETINIRGELMLVGDTYKELGFKSARNGTAGIINRDGIRNCKHISPFFYEIIDDIKKDEDEKWEMLYNYFECQRVPGSIVYEYDKTIDAAKELSEYLKACKEDLNYEIDGLVITPIDYKRENVLKPENKICFKVDEDGVNANVIDIEWNVSRTGRIIPVVIIEPINIEGVIINRATGFNAKFIEDNKIAKGSEISIIRAGSVIPHIVEVTLCASKSSIPSICPSCNGPLISEGVDLICNNPECYGMLYYKVEHFLHKMGTENITYKTLMKLGLGTIEKCYEIDEWEIASIDGFGVKRAQQVVDEIQNTLITTPEKFIASLGIPGVGKTLAKAMCDVFDIDIDNFFLFNSSYEDFIDIDGIGEIIANNIIETRMNYFSLFMFLLEKGMKFESTGSNELEGKQFCLTGKGDIGRSELGDMITSKGGVIKGISKGIDYLVTADPESQSGKAKKARKYGVKIISYSELIEILTGG